MLTTIIAASDEKFHQLISRASRKSAIQRSDLGLSGGPTVIINLQPHLHTIPSPDEYAPAGQSSDAVAPATIQASQTHRPRSVLDLELCTYSHYIWLDGTVSPHKRQHRRPPEVSVYVPGLVASHSSSPDGRDGSKGCGRSTRQVSQSLAVWSHRCFGDHQAAATKKTSHRAVITLSFTDQEQRCRSRERTRSMLKHLRNGAEIRPSGSGVDGICCLSISYGFCTLMGLWHPEQPKTRTPSPLKPISS